MMPRPRSPNRDRAHEIFKQHNGNIENRRIAEQLGEDERLIAVWKQRDDWVKKNNDVQQTNAVHQMVNKKRTSNNDKEKSTNDALKTSAKKNKKSAEEKSENVGTADTNTKKRGAPFGNKRAVGNRGGNGGPLRNKHGLRNHLYETVFFADIYDDSERAILDMDFDKYAHQDRLIKTLLIREKRIKEDIRKIKETPGGMFIESISKNKGTTAVSNKHRNKKGERWDGDSSTVAEDTSTHVAKPEIYLRQSLESALDKVRSQLQKAIELFHKMELDDNRLELDYKKYDFALQRITGQIDLAELIDEDDLGFDFDE